MATKATARMGFGALALAVTLAYVALFALPMTALGADGENAELAAADMTAQAPLTSQDMYRMYNPNSGEHFYTADIEERNSLYTAGWSYEQIGWVAPATSSTPVYRLYNPNAGDHHYTTDEAERDMLVEAGWNFEKIGWYSDDAKTVPVMRQYNPNALSGAHNFTTDEAECDNLVAAGWRDEDIGWYAVAPRAKFTVKREAETAGLPSVAPSTFEKFETACGGSYTTVYEDTKTRIVFPSGSPYGFIYKYENTYEGGKKYWHWHYDYGTVACVKDIIDGNFTQPMDAESFAARLVAPKPFKHNMPAFTATYSYGVSGKLSLLGDIVFITYSGLEESMEEGMSGAGYGEGLQIVLDENGLVSPDSLCCLWGVAG